MPPQYGPHRWSAGDRDDGRNAEFRGAHFDVKDLRGARFVDCDLTGVKLVDAALVHVDLSGYVEDLVVNGVDVTEFVESELDRRHPERVLLRGVRGVDDFRGLWDTLEGLWADAVARVERLPEAARHERVDDEWSFVETLRHLVFITDSWGSRALLDEPDPFHPLGLPQTAYASADAVALGLDPAARPSYSEVLAARRDRQAVVRRIVGALADSDLGRLCSRPPAPGYPEEERAVWSCVSVVMEEEAEHLRFALRDLAALEARSRPVRPAGR